MAGRPQFDDPWSRGGLLRFGFGGFVFARIILRRCWVFPVASSLGGTSLCLVVFVGDVEFDRGSGVISLIHPSGSSPSVAAFQHPSLWWLGALVQCTPEQPDMEASPQPLLLPLHVSGFKQHIKQLPYWFLGGCQSCHAVKD